MRGGNKDSLGKGDSFNSEISEYIKKLGSRSGLERLGLENCTHPVHPL